MTDWTPPRDAPEVVARPRRGSAPKLPGLFLRVLSYIQRELEEFEVERWKKRMKYCGEGVQLSSKCSIWGYEEFSIGDGATINQFTHIFASGGVEIGRGVMISSNCSISSVTHPIAAADRTSHPLVMKPVRIGDKVWIGMGAVIMPGVTIGDNAVVGAGSVVTRDVAASTVVAGSPARVLQNIDALEAH